MKVMNTGVRWSMLLVLCICDPALRLLYEQALRSVDQQ
jgi:hypothetical protein